MERKTLETLTHNIKGAQEMHQKAGVGVHTINPSTVGQRQAGLCEFETTTVCLVPGPSEPHLRTLSVVVVIINNKPSRPGVALPILNPSTGEAEAGGPPV